MTDNTEPTIDELIRLKLLSLIHNLQDVWLEDKDSWYGATTTIPEIQALISDQVAKARLDELSRVPRGGIHADEYHEYYEISLEYFDKRISQLNGVKNND